MHHYSFSSEIKTGGKVKAPFPLTKANSANLCSHFKTKKKRIKHPILVKHFMLVPFTGATLSHRAFKGSLQHWLSALALTKRHMTGKGTLRMTANISFEESGMMDQQDFQQLWTFNACSCLVSGLQVQYHLVTLLKCKILNITLHNVLQYH